MTIARPTSPTWRRLACSIDLASRSYIRRTVVAGLGAISGAAPPVNYPCRVHAFLRRTLD
jgi:hypothetical protein